ncbi:RNA polymerase sigma-70 factor, ECF subfamily [Amycolatopsis arida]|uniref:RNA polymerase sigma-70 factor, ECF subfamily n=1 Tax=Amycolatopsis arida TaxID=587909 RepID=A0A1I5QK18_9PSEU|nr:RNA polymerase sigma factor [Amycolatopsis arida]TDX98872.1 RNA polymerase sigma-70 factor (ECF subfamily) [Amycolatopsis arida]SFP46583.1 RNA polymerase sigma-70 factor, ECF subfamily [Amycolatopsis arida]
MNPSEPDDDAAVIAQSLRDPDRFAVLFDRHGPHIQRYLVRRLGRDTADDLLAETFLTAFAKRRQYDPRRPHARPWLYGIATNLVSRHRRAEAREGTLLGTLTAVGHEDGHADRVAARVTAEAMGRLLGTALAELADGDRDVLLLIAWEGLAYDEVAEALDIPIGTVRSRLNRARRKVRQALDTPHPTTLREGVHHHG